ncbi:P-type ATPase [Rhizobium lentis]|uniref:P-type ATPase n=1 Tax=Rhizobium lentis TaxID=1138194 RepID=UPI0035C89474
MTVPIPQPFAPKLRDRSGLVTEEAESRLVRFGPNILPEPEAPSFAFVFLRQFRSPLIYILFLAAAISLVISDTKDAVFIGVVLLLNGLIGSLQEYSAGRAAQALRKLEQPRAAVIRDGEVRGIEARLLVPGDLVLLEAGGRVPADVALGEATDLLCDESVLTGESMAARKVSAPVAEGKTAVAFAGTFVTRGRGTGIVTGTGLATEIGRIAAEIGKASASQPPLMIRLARFSNAIAGRWG